VGAALSRTGDEWVSVKYADLFIYAPVMAHAHGTPEVSELDPALTELVAETMQALSTPSRLKILGRLAQGPCGVNALAEAVEMRGSAVSHQLRILRHLGLVVGRRDGRRMIYDLYDDHVALLLEQAISHVEHLRHGQADRESPIRTPREGAVR
jgi:DNA-binding transcriptional ArsR family regulator